MLLDVDPRLCQIIHHLHLDHYPGSSSSHNNHRFDFFCRGVPSGSTELVSQFTIEWSIHAFVLMTVFPYALHRLSFIASIHLLIVS